MRKGNYKTLIISYSFYCCIFSFTIHYFNKCPEPFEEAPGYGVWSKKMKIQGNREIRIVDLDIVNACFTLLKFAPEYFRHKWRWSLFVKKYLNHNEEGIKW